MSLPSYECMRWTVLKVLLPRLDSVYLIHIWHSSPAPLLCIKSEDAKVVLSTFSSTLHEWPLFAWWYLLSCGAITPHEMCAQDLRKLKLAAELAGPTVIGNKRHLLEAYGGGWRIQHGDTDL